MALSVLSIALLGCNEEQKTLKIKGSDTEVNLAVDLAENFFSKNKLYSISVSGGGSGMGIASLFNGQADIANSSRPLSDEEKQMFEQNNIQLKTFIFAQDATAIIVNKDNPLEELDTNQLADILSGKIDNWKELNGQDIKINIYGRQSNSGTHSYIQKKLKIKFSQRANEMNGNAQIIVGIKVDPRGIGYVGAGYILGDTQHLKVKPLKIKINKNSQGVSPLDKPAVQAGKYFFQRPLFQFVRVEKWNEALPFLTFEKSQQGKQLISSSGYYLPE